MPEVMRIRSRDAFAEVLAEARARADVLLPGDPRLMNQVVAQLEHMARVVLEERRGPTADECARVNLGVLAAREFEATEPGFADQLQELDYTFRRYPQLCAGASRRRRGILQVWSGPGSFRKLILEPGVPQTVGTAGADLVVDGDEPRSPQFEVVWDGVAAHVLAIEPHAIRVGGVSALLGELANHGWMSAGDTTFRFFVEDYTPTPELRTPTPGAEAALERLHGRRGLYAVLDAARASRVLVLLNEAVDAHASLYDGEGGRAFDDVAPYLVQLRPDSQLLVKLIAEGWGDAWGIWIVGGGEFEAVRRHLRKFLKVDDRAGGRRLLFRFYDPRVLRSFVEVAKPAQADELTGEFEELLFEREDGAVGTQRRGG